MCDDISRYTLQKLKHMIYIVRYYAASNESCMQYSTYLVLRDKAQVFCQLFKEFVFHPRFNRWVDLVILL